MHNFVIVIRSAYFGAQEHRKYAKSVRVNRSANGTNSRTKISFNSNKYENMSV